MISPERKQFNADVRELGELSYSFNEKLKNSLITLLRTQPDSKISFKHDKPKMVRDTSNGKITLATMSAIWIEEDSIMAQLAWKDEGVAFNDPVCIDLELDDIYHNIFNLTSAIQDTLKEKENPKPQAEKTPQQPKQQDSLFGKLLGKFMLLLACLAPLHIFASQNIQLDSVKLNQAGEQYTYTFDYQSQNTITCYVHHFNWEKSAWEVNEKRVLTQDAHTANFCRYYLNNNQWEPENPYIYEYDDNGNLIAQSANGQRYTHEVDSKGNNIKTCAYQWENNAWKMYSYIESVWENNLLITVNTYQLGNDNNYNLYSQYIYSYDDNGQLVSSIGKDVTGHYTGKMEYQFDNDTETQTSFSWDETNSTWIPNWKSELVTDTKGLIVSQTSYNYNNGQWEGDHRYTSLYDDNENLISGKHEYFQDNQWVLSYENQFTYRTDVLAASITGYLPFENYIRNAGVKTTYSYSNPLLEETTTDSEGITSTPISYFYSDDKTNGLQDIELLHVIIIGQTIISPVQASIFDLQGKNVTTLNGHLQSGVYIVTSNSKSIKAHIP